MRIKDLTNNNEVEYIAAAHFNTSPPHELYRVCRMSDRLWLNFGEFEVVQTNTPCERLAYRDIKRLEDEVDLLQAELRIINQKEKVELTKVLKRIRSACGIPDPVQACRVILKIIDADKEPVVRFLVNEDCKE